MDAVSLASIAVAGIAALGAWASQRAASRSALVNTVAGGRVDMEKEAYARARDFDTETIARQDAEIAELRNRNEAYDKKLEVMRETYEEEIRNLRARIARLERGLSMNLEEILRERYREHNSRAGDPKTPD